MQTALMTLSYAQLTVVGTVCGILGGIGFLLMMYHIGEARITITIEHPDND